MAPFNSLDNRMQSVLASVHAGSMTVRTGVNIEQEETRIRPFVTISRQTGSGGWSLAQRLVVRLNQVNKQESLWTAFDRELVEKVAQDHNISEQLIESLGQRRPTWLDDLCRGLSTTLEKESPDEFKIYRRVAKTIRALAQVGHVVIVGRGGVYITHDMPGGIHLRLVAPLDFRVREMARKFNLTPAQALCRVKETDRARQEFYRRHWLAQVMTPETFTLFINTAQVPEETVVEMLLPLIAAKKVEKISPR